MSLITQSGNAMIFQSSNVTMEAGKTYVSNNAVTRVEFTLPSSPKNNQFFRIVGFEAAGWKLLVNTGQNLVCGPIAISDTGEINSQLMTDSIEVICVSESPTLYIGYSSQGPSLNNFNMQAGGRLTPTRFKPVETDDISGATELYYEPYKNNIISLYHEGSFGINAWIQHNISPDLFYALPNILSPQDIFILDSGGGNLQMDAAAWASDTARNIALTSIDGVWVLSTDHKKRYVGTIYNNGGSMEFTHENRGIWNQDNRLPFQIFKVITSPDTWTYDTNAWRYANGDIDQASIKFVIGQIEDSIIANLQGAASNSGGTSTVTVGIGINAPSPSSFQSFIMATTLTPLTSNTSLYPRLGANTLSMLENTLSVPAGTTTYYGDNGAFSIFTGLSGILMC